MPALVWLHVPPAPPCTILDELKPPPPPKACTETFPKVAEELPPGKPPAQKLNGLPAAMAKLTVPEITVVALATAVYEVTAEPPFDAGTE
jgi:hypothetical protein